MGKCFDEKFGPPPPLLPPYVAFALTGLVCGCILVLMRPPFVVVDKECSASRVVCITLACVALASLPHRCGKSSDELVRDAVAYITVR